MDMNSITKNLLKAGFLPLPIWLGVTTLAGFLVANYSPIESHVSVIQLQDGVSHTLVNIAALISGASLIAFSIGVWRLSGRMISAGALSMMAFGVAMIGNGIWPMGDPMHGVYVIGIFNIISPALCLMDIRDDALRQRLHAVTAIVSVSAMVYLWLNLTGFEPEGLSGLTQRIFGSINFSWPLLFAYQALKRA